MALLSSPLPRIQSTYDVVVVGSGYGGSITAARLSRARKADGSPVRVCLLERGREIPIGSFPDRLTEAARELQVDSPPGHVGRKDGLYDFRVSDDISVFQGCGLGGTSLVNANVALPPEARVFADERWPKGLIADRAGLERGIGLARQMLRPVAYPVGKGRPALSKFEALESSAAAMGKTDRLSRPPINVNFETARNHVGVHQEACNGCGDCVSGCNVGAKNTLMMNYLPDARNHGAEIYTGVQVRRVEPAGSGWLVHYQPIGYHRDAFDGPALFVRANVVVVSAGTLGSSEIMLRSKQSGLTCSDRVGHGFTGNGDVLGLAYNNECEINGVGTGDQRPDPAHPPGPCITGIIDLREQDILDDGFVIEEGVIPGALATILPAALASAAALTGTGSKPGFRAWAGRTLRRWTSYLFGARRGAVRNTQTFLIMAHDDGQGRLVLEDDRVRIQWPRVGKGPLFQRLNKALEDATRATGGIYVPSPTFNQLFGYDLVTVHPLGGCAMGNDAATGVVNHKGQVFRANVGDEVYTGLYVSDGSVMPRPVGVNPLLTISAISERNAAIMAAERGWQIDTAMSGVAAEFDGTRTNAGTIGLHFTERMAGHCSMERLDDYQTAAAHGKTLGSTCSFTLTAATEDLDHMLSEPAHEALLIGTVEVPKLSPKPMTTSAGRFNLFIEDGPKAQTKHMRYRMRLHTDDGRNFWFDGFKVVRDDAGADLWEDTSTLYITIHRGDDDTGDVVAKGVLRIAESDFAKQSTTMVALDADGSPSLAGVAKFGEFFAGQLWETYKPKLEIGSHT